MDEIHERRHEIIGAVFIAISVLLGAGYMIDSASLLRQAVNFFSYYIGAGVLLFSLLFWLKGVDLFRGRESGDHRLEAMGWFFLLVFVITVSADMGFSGGIIGSGMSESLAVWFGGVVGRRVIQLLLFTLSISLIFDISLKAAFFILKDRIWNLLKIIKDRISGNISPVADEPVSSARKIKNPKTEPETADVIARIEEPLIVPPVAITGLVKKSGKAETNENKDDYSADDFSDDSEEQFDEPVYDVSENPSPEICENDEPEIAESEEDADDVEEDEFSDDEYDIDEDIDEDEDHDEYETGEERFSEVEEDDDYDDYVLPPVSLLNEAVHGEIEDEQTLQAKGEKLIKTLREFAVEAQLIGIVVGPRVSRFEFTVKAGTKVSKVAGLSSEISMALEAKSVRIEAPIPGKAAIGVEIPNHNPQSVFFRETMESEEFNKCRSLVPMAFGKNISGDIVVGRLEKMPHLLVAGTTGAGKSVCVNGIIGSILFRARPDEVKFIMIDPKMVELSSYNDLPHLLTPVVTDPKKAAAALQWAVEEMEDRYRLLSSLNLKQISEYNDKALAAGNMKIMPYIVVIIDELADLMMVAKAEVEDSIIRIAQKARAVGIHLIVATQRPSVDVVTGLIKANLPSRIAFTVRSSIDSRTILDSPGAEKLLGQGDMLYFPTGVNNPIRVQNAFIDTEETLRVLDFIKEQKTARYLKEVEEFMQNSPDAEDVELDDVHDEFLKDAIRLVVENKSPSVSMLQRKLKVGHSRAGRLMDIMEQLKIVSPMQGNRREIMVKAENLENILEKL